jgi:hypothetical protein
MYTDFADIIPTYTLTEEFGGVTKTVEFKESNMEVTFYHFMEFMEYAGFDKESMKELFEEYFRDMNPKEDE